LLLRFLAVAVFCRVRRQLGWVRPRSATAEADGRHLRPPALALDWIRSQEVATGGIKVASDRPDAYPEVTGYLVPTIIRYGERELAVRSLRWLAAVQQSDGSYQSPEGLSLVFDTAQALRGLLAGIGLERQALGCARKAADYVYRELLENGSGGHTTRLWYRIPEGVNLYVLPALIRAGEVFHRPEYARLAQQCLEHHLRGEQGFRRDILTHFLGYQAEALIDLGRMDVASHPLSWLREEQRPDGSVPGLRDAPWVCTPGLAQLAVCWYKTGQWPAADRAMEWLDARQEASGGFFGSYGEKAWYFPDAEIPWAAKFYLDANLLRIQSFFDRTTMAIPRRIRESDGRAQAVLSAARPRIRILDVGCGKGRYSRLLKTAYPDAECLCLDACEKVLQHVPKDVPAVQGSMEMLPYRAESFDLVFVVEALEHSSNFPAAVCEILRVTRPAGTILVIDKQRSHWGALDCPPWEYWPEAKELEELLRRECNDVEVQSVSYDDESEEGGLMLAWKGRKQPNLESGAERQGPDQVEPRGEVLRGTDAPTGAILELQDHSPEERRLARRDDSSLGPRQA
jgi:malonyl-CoA O-methyltransferase